MWLAYLVIGFAAEPPLGVLILIIGPIIALIYLAFFRMMLEMYYAMIRMSEDIREMRNRQRGT